MLVILCMYSAYLIMHISFLPKEGLSQCVWIREGAR